MWNSFPDDAAIVRICHHDHYYGARRVMQPSGATQKILAKVNKSLDFPSNYCLSSALSRRMQMTEHINVEGLLWSFRCGNYFSLRKYTADAHSAEAGTLAHRSSGHGDRFGQRLHHRENYSTHLFNPRECGQTLNLA